MGAKCSSIFVSTPDIKILIDPGAAVMQPGYPLPKPLKEYFCVQAFKQIQKAGEKADAVVISHYHYDHHTRLDTEAFDFEKVYKYKIIWAKNPNQWINNSQWQRSRIFFTQLYQEFSEINPEKIFFQPSKKSFKNPLISIPSATRKNFGDYNRRRKELLRKGEKWFEKLSRTLWAREPWVQELNLPELKVKFIDGKKVKIGKTTIRFTPPLFHGIEFDRVGWIVAVVIEYGGRKILYSSDLQGPAIEDYAEWIIKENPEILFLDGPPTYLFGYMLNRINLNRSIENICRIIENTTTKLIILDHHLLRDGLYMERLAPVYKLAKRRRKKVITAAEYLGEQPMIFKALHWKENPDELKPLLKKARRKLKQIEKQVG